jgi:hypothetical protein
MTMSAVGQQYVGYRLDLWRELKAALVATVTAVGQ